MASKKGSAAFGRLLTSISTGGGTVIEYGDAKIKVRNISMGEARRIDSVRKAAEEAGDDSFAEELLTVFIQCAMDAETGEPWATEADRDGIRASVPSELILRVFQAAAVPDIGKTTKN